MENANPRNIGLRVEMHPATDAWMSGDRYGEVVGVTRARECIDTFTGDRYKLRLYRVKLDRSGRTCRVHPENLHFI